MVGCLRRTVAALGGAFGGVHTLKHWPRYFPHVDGASLGRGFHRQLDGLQGRRRTHYVGEVFNLPTVSECIDFARYVIRRHFAPVRPAARH